MYPQKLFSIVALAALTAAAQSSAFAAEASKARQLTFSKVFPKSEPEYMLVVVEETGEAQIDIRRLDQPAHPDALQLSRETTARLFQLAAQLNYFRGQPDWEPKTRVAEMGRKTLAYDDASEHNAVSFNYAPVSEVQRLVELFEGLARAWYYHERIARALVYDRLSLLELVRQLESEFNRGHIAEPALLVPVLRRLVNDSRILHLVQTKAQRLLERIGDAQATISFARMIQSNPGVYLALSVRENGEASYEMRGFEAAPMPRRLTLAPALVARLFELVARLNHFHSEPNPGLENVPQAAERTTLTYEHAAERHELQFSATKNPLLRELTSLAERILRQQWHRQNLEATRAQPEQLGLAVALLEEDVRKSLLIDPAELASLLSEIASDARVPPATQQQALALAARLKK